MLFLLGQHVAPAQSTPVRSLLSRYIGALQQRDYKTLVELNADTLRESSIRRNNPRFLWAKLIAENRERRVRDLTPDPRLATAGRRLVSSKRELGDGSKVPRADDSHKVLRAQAGIE